MVDVDVTITDINPEGLGQSQVNERPLLVRNALPGEQVSARILKKRKGVRFADGYLQGSPNPERIVSACTAFPRCGGCNLHHLSYPAQLSLKQSQLERALVEHQVQPRQWRAPVSAQKSGYRTKARLGVRQLGDQVLVGFRESFSNRVARLHECLTLTPRLSSLLLPLRQMIAQLSQPNQIPQIELAQGDDGVSVIVRHLYELTAADMDQLAVFQRATRTDVVLQSAGYDTLRGLAHGQEKPAPRTYQLPRHGLTMHFQPHQFTQVNMAVNQLLIDAVCAYLTPRPKRLVDLFCGIGNFSLPLARKGVQVLGVEAVESAVEQARLNAQFNGVPCAFDVADLYSADISAELIEAVAGADALLLDPPRSGAGPQLARWLEVFHGGHIVYVSCNPKSFAEDAAALQNAGFVLQEVGVFDMFPYTAHIETLGYFVRS